MGSQTIKTILAGCLLTLLLITGAFSEEPGHIQVLDVEGKVLLQRDTPWWRFWDYQRLEKDDFLLEGDLIRTRSNSKISLKCSNETLINIGPHSVLTVDKATPKTTRLSIRKGSLGAKVITFIEGITTLEIETPSSIASVRGTEFFLEVDWRKTLLKVASGEVSLTAQDKKVMVGQGQMSSVLRNNPPEKPRPLPEDKEELIQEKIPDHAGPPSDTPGPPSDPPGGKPEDKEE